MSELAFAGIPATPAGHFGLLFHAAIYRLLNHLRRLAGGDPAGVLARHAFLASYGQAMQPYLPRGLSWDGALGWWEREILAWETRAGAELPLLALAREGGLDIRERLALLVVGLGEEDGRFGSLLAEIQEPAGRRRPCLELLGRVMSADGVDVAAVGARLHRVLAGAGLVEVVDRDAPRSEWELRVPGPVWEALRDGVAALPGGWTRRDRAALPALEDLVLPGDLRVRLAEAPPVLSAGASPGVIVQGTTGSDRVEVLAALARALGRGVIEVVLGEATGPLGWSLLGPLCTLTRAMPVVVADPAPGERLVLPPLAGYRGPLGVAVGPAGAVTGALGPDAIALTLPAPTPAERREHWSRALAGHAGPDLDAIADRFRLAPAHLRQAAAGAIVRARLDRRATVTAGDVAAAGRALNRERLDTLAVRVEPGEARDVLVVSAGVAARLDELARRCRHRDALDTHVGPAVAAGSHRGVRALFTGASGTGKTLAARLLAAELGMDLYRVDLAAVVNKYIGETEKSLHRVLAAAEELDVVLLLDEGEALLGHRTEVRTANDRWSNLETDFLLQRLETHQGILVVTTNAADGVDPAFQRRMDVVVSFVPPQASERCRLLELHLPPGHAVAREDLEGIAVRCAMTGGQIRNAALHAALLALDEACATVERRHLEAAIEAEYRKAGAIAPRLPAGEAGAAASPVDAFVRGLAGAA